VQYFNTASPITAVMLWTPIREVLGSDLDKSQLQPSPWIPRCFSDFPGEFRVQPSNRPLPLPSKLAAAHQAWSYSHSFQRCVTNTGTEARIFSVSHRVHTGSRAHPASYPMGTGCVKLTTLIYCRNWECVDLHLYSYVFVASCLVKQMDSFNH
jgi:hypothetical protein